MARRRTARREAGMVSAELALSIPAILAVVALVVQALMLVIAQVECVDAARAGARAAARGESTAQIHDAALEVAPDGADVRVRTGDDRVTVTVEASPPLAARWLGLVPNASAVARVEPS